VHKNSLAAPSCNFISTASTGIKTLMEQALKGLVANGAEIVDPFEIPNFSEHIKDIGASTFSTDVNTYLAPLGDRAPYQTVEDIFASKLYAPSTESSLKRSLEAAKPTQQPADVYHREQNIAFREAVLAAMNAERLDAIIYPTWSNPPRKVGDTESPAGDNSQHLAPHTGFPAITVPMGHTHGVLPAGLTFVGRLFSEPDLIGFTYAFEPATQHRPPPPDFHKDSDPL
jgi:Asp-tRNA(Asn)/Glu-tRNA(Gln) amidotransferase A subunit family amidase